MQSFNNIKKYITDSYNFAMTEAWQLGSDARSEAYNIYSDMTS